jgi:hypothetical protein
VIVREISSKKPIDKSRPNENNRVRITVKMALRGLAFTSQITFMLSVTQQKCLFHQEVS